MRSLKQKLTVGLCLLLVTLSFPSTLFSHPVPNNSRKHVVSGKSLPKPSSDVILTNKASADSQDNNDVVFTASISTAIYSALYDGVVTYGMLKRFGDMGLGAPDRIDGEVFAVDGRFYNILADGSIYELADSEKASWATVKFFRPDRILTFDKPISCPDLYATLDTLYPTLNVMYAFRIDGAFSYMQTESTPGQRKPYIPFLELLAQATQFYNYDVQGTVVGFRFPAYMEQVNVGGYHMHFLSDDKKVGGHIKDCTMNRGRVAIDVTHKADVIVPRDKDFYESPLDGP